MSIRTGNESNDRLFCWEHVSRTRPVFRTSQVFAPRQHVHKLLPVYALFSVVEDIFTRISDEDVARSKLAWWRMECVQKDPAESHHPVLREMKRTGALELLHAELFRQMFDSAESRLDASAPADMGALNELCVAMQLPQLEMEMAVCDIRPGALQLDPRMMASNGQVQLIRESAALNESGGFWWVPLNLLARHGIGRDEIANRPDAAGVGALFDDLFEARDSSEGDVTATGKSKDIHQARHIFAISGLYAQQLKHLQKCAPGKYREELQKAKLTDLFTAWRCARQLRWR